MDIGGGSTEFVVGDEHVQAARSVDIGCVRLTERHLSLAATRRRRSEIAAIRADIEAALDLAEETVPLARGRARWSAWPARSPRSPAIALGLDAYDSAAIHHSRISVEQVREITERAARVHPRRARRDPRDAPGPGRCDRRRGAGPAARSWSGPGRAEVVVSEHDILDGIAWSIA